MSGLHLRSVAVQASSFTLNLAVKVSEINAFVLRGRVAF